MKQSVSSKMCRTLKSSIAGIARIARHGPVQPTELIPSEMASKDPENDEREKQCTIVSTVFQVQQGFEREHFQTHETDGMEVTLPYTG